MRYLIITLILVSITSFSGILLAQTPPKFHPEIALEETVRPEAPDYQNPGHWAALPQKEDLADVFPKRLDAPEEEQAVDVFFIHPTTYTGRKKNETQWNASLDDQEINEKTDESTIKYQSSAFNKAGQVYAPRYRQAHLYSFFALQVDSVKESASASINLAYEDVKTAFLYYLENYNKDRPFIIASHSQGTIHAKRLIKELVDGTDLKSRLVAAYLVGVPVAKDAFKNIKPCETPEQTQCFCSWRTFARDYYPPWYQESESNILVTNPLTWTTDNTYADYSENKGAVLKKFNKIRKHVIDAQVHNGLLWVNRPKMFGARLIKMKNYHVADINLFYMNVRDNADRRAEAFMNGTTTGISTE